MLVKAEAVEAVPATLAGTFLVLDLMVIRAQFCILSNDWAILMDPYRAQDACCCNECSWYILMDS